MFVGLVIFGEYLSITLLITKKLAVMKRRNKVIADACTLLILIIYAIDV